MEEPKVDNLKKPKVVDEPWKPQVDPKDEPKDIGPKPIVPEKPRTWEPPKPEPKP